jgi:hypothetical protein
MPVDQPRISGKVATRRAPLTECALLASGSPKAHVIWPPAVTCRIAQRLRFCRALAAPSLLRPAACFVGFRMAPVRPAHDRFEPIDSLRRSVSRPVNNRHFGESLATEARSLRKRKAHRALQTSFGIHRDADGGDAPAGARSPRYTRLQRVAGVVTLACVVGAVSACDVGSYSEADIRHDALELVPPNAHDVSVLVNKGNGSNPTMSASVNFTLLHRTSLQRIAE